MKLLRTLCEFSVEVCRHNILTCLHNKYVIHRCKKDIYNILCKVNYVLLSKQNFQCSRNITRNTFGNCLNEIKWILNIIDRWYFCTWNSSFQVKPVLRVKSCFNGRFTNAWTIMIVCDGTNIHLKFNTIL